MGGKFARAQRPDALDLSIAFTSNALTYVPPTPITPGNPEGQTSAASFAVPNALGVFVPAAPITPPLTPLDAPVQLSGSINERPRAAWVQLAARRSSLGPIFAEKQQRDEVQRRRSFELISIASGSLAPRRTVFSLQRALTAACIGLLLIASAARLFHAIAVDRLVSNARPARSSAYRSRPVSQHAEIGQDRPDFHFAGTAAHDSRVKSTYPIVFRPSRPRRLLPTRADLLPVGFKETKKLVQAIRADAAKFGPPVGSVKASSSAPIVDPKYTQLFDGTDKMFEFHYGREALDLPSKEAEVQEAEDRAASKLERAMSKLFDGTDRIAESKTQLQERQADDDAQIRTTADEKLQDAIEAAMAVEPRPFPFQRRKDLAARLTN